jgi:hypothetical protein
MTGAPTWVDQSQLEELGIALSKTALERLAEGEGNGEDAEV